MRSAARLTPALAGGALALAGCGPQHQLSRIENGDHTLVATVDYMPATFGFTHDAAISLQEKRGLASNVASFRNVTRIEVSWLGPEDLNVCEVGQIVGYRTSVVLNTSTGKRTVHVRYGC